MTALDRFTVGTAAFCRLFPINESTFASLRDRDGLFFTRSDARRGVANDWTLPEALTLALAQKLKDNGIPSRDACAVATGADVLTPFLAGKPVQFGFLGGRISTAFDPARDPVLSVPIELEGRGLINQFAAAMVAAEGGAAAQEALDGFIQRLRAARGL